MQLQFTSQLKTFSTIQREDLVQVARVLKFLYYTTIVAAFCANMIVVSQTTILTVLGASMALRGPDGSMMTATDGLYIEQSSVFYWFGVGLANTVGCVTVGVWLILDWEAALCCMAIVLFTCRKMWINYKRVQRRFAFDENETVDFVDIMEGPANIQAMPGDRRIRSSRKTQNGMAKYSRNASYSDDDWSGNWQPSNDSDVMKRRAVSPNPGKTIQMV